MLKIADGGTFVVIENRFIGTENHKLPGNSFGVEPAVPITLECFIEILVAAPNRLILRISLENQWLRRAEVARLPNNLTVVNDEECLNFVSIPRRIVCVIEPNYSVWVYSFAHETNKFAHGRTHRPVTVKLNDSLFGNVFFPGWKRSRYIFNF